MRTKHDPNRGSFAFDTIDNPASIAPDYMQDFFRNAARLDRRRQPRRAIGLAPQHSTKLNPIYTY